MASVARRAYPFAMNRQRLTKGGAVAIGIAVGAALGVALDALAVGVGVGAAFGVAAAAIIGRR